MHTRRSLLLACVIAVAATGASGCGSDDCEDLCEAAKECEGSDTPSGEDCATECADLEEVADAAGCSDQYEEFIECAVDADDVCNAGDACGVQGISFAFCVLPYCTEHPSDPACGDEPPSSGCTLSSIFGPPDCTLTAECATGTFELDCLGDQCICIQDGMETATVANEAAFCDGGLQAQIDRAAQVCGWTLPE